MDGLNKPRLWLSKASPYIPRNVEDVRERVVDRLTVSEDRRLLGIARAGRPVCWSDDGESEPLVTIRIATFNRGALVAERALASAVRQTYQRVEILVIGDHCDEATATAVRSVGDPRLRFVNLPARGLYPESVRGRRMVAGGYPMNVGNALAEGAWIAPLDDDDEFTEDHVERLVAEARLRQLEMIYSKARYERTPGTWIEIGGEPLRRGNISHGTVLYSSGLRFLRYSSTCWKRGEPADWNMWRRMRAIGVRIGFLNAVTFTQYLGAQERAAVAAVPPVA